MSIEPRPGPDDIPGQTLPYPAKQSDMTPQPDSDLSNYRPADKLAGKVAIITGGDSGIGRAVAIAYAMEGAKVAIAYNVNDDDAAETKRLVDAKGGECLVIKADVRSMAECQGIVDQTVAAYGGLNILVSNAAFQASQQRFEDIDEDQFRRTLETNIFGCYHMASAALPHLTEGDCIINTGSIVGMVGNKILIDYCASKGAIHAFTTALALNLGERKIRVNCVAPGPIWTPNIPGTMPNEEVETFGHEVALARPGQPEEVAPAFVFLAAEDSSYITGAILEVTGGKLSSD